MKYEDFEFHVTENDTPFDSKKLVKYQIKQWQFINVLYNPFNNKFMHYFKRSLGFKELAEITTHDDSERNL